jgi:hypothetical protein
MRDADTYLSELEIARLTGKKYPKVQARALADRGWTFVLDGDGLPLVLRAYHDARLGIDPKPTRPRQPRLEGLARRSA